MTPMLYTSEFVSGGHPDKVCDRISDACLDQMLDLAAERGHDGSSVRAAVETLIKDNLVLVSGEVSAPKDVLADLDIDAAVRDAWSRSGYDHAGAPTILDFVKPQSPEIAHLVDGEGQAEGAGDQGIMCGYAYRWGEMLMPPEYEMARQIIGRLDTLRHGGTLDYLRSDAKSQISIDAGGTVHSVIVSTQHSAEIGLDQLRHDVMEHAVRPVVGDIDPDLVKINHKGSFVVGGAAADCGVTGRKIVVDQYGPRAQVGGGAFSGKDPSKVDRSAAYMARAIALDALRTAYPDARSVAVQLAYGIGQVQPASVMAILDCGTDVSDWLRDTYADLSPSVIQKRLGLWRRDGWRYGDTAAMGHFGRAAFPWEQPAG